MKTRPLLFASALFCSTSAFAEPIAAPVDVCTVVTNTKGGPMTREVPCPEPTESEEPTEAPGDTAPPIDTAEQEEE